MEMKRTILAVVLSMAVLILFQKYMAPTPHVTPVNTQAPAVAAPVATTPAVSAAGTPTAATVPPPAAQGIVHATLESDLLKVELSSRGGVVVSASLANYRQAPARDAPAVQLLGSSSGEDVAGATRLLNTQPNGELEYSVEQQSPSRVVFAAVVGNGITLRKTYTLERGKYDVGLVVEVGNGGASVLHDRLGTALVQDFGGHEDRYAFNGPAYFKGDSYEEIKLKKIIEGVQDAGEIFWAAFLEKYFLVALVPEQQAGMELRVLSHGGAEKIAELWLNGPAFDLAPGAVQTVSTRIYLGPKQASILKPLGSHLDQMLNYGFFNIIAQPLMVFLNWIYSYIGNYGIAIIILTTLIKGVFWPLSAKSYKSMQRMKELQPKMARLKERHAGDKERLNMEVMQLYKTHKVNPLGGCLPMVVQIPFFFALYRILLGSIELRHAPFMLWITDLSAKDPYYITPLLMGATMFLQQKMTPSTGGNETQMKMMMYGMPIVFTFMFLNFPSGLVVYWLVNNVLSIAQQGMMLRQARSQSSAPA